MNVVRIILKRIEALHTALSDVVLVGFDGADIAFGGGRIPTNTQVDMRRHVNQVPRPGHQPPQPLGAPQGPLGSGGGFYGMDIVVIRTGMKRFSLEDGFEGRNKFHRARVRPTILPPVVPGTKVHQGRSIEGGGIGIIRITLRKFPHRPCIGPIESFPVRALLIGISFR